MKIAVAKEGSNVSGHFGHCEGFQTYVVENNEINGSEFIPNPGHRPGFLPVFLTEKNVNVIISGGMGATAQKLFNKNSISVVVGAAGNVEDVIMKYLEGKLESTGSICEEHAHHDSCGK